MLRLIATYDHAEQIFAIPEGEARLGSAPENDMVLRVPGVSRRHALVRRCPGGVEIVDLRSKNGLFVEGEQVTRATLTPSLRVQIGAAWLGIEEVSGSGEALALLFQDSSEEIVRPSTRTGTLGPRRTPGKGTPAETALALAYHIAQFGVGLPGTRADLLARIKAALGATAFASFERTRRGKLHILESLGEFSSEETRALAFLAAGASSSAGGQVVLQRTGPLLLAGRDAWFLGASFPEESLAREGWRKDFLRFLAHELFLPVRNLDEVNAEEATRVLAFARGNKKRAAALLGVSRGTLYNLLARRNAPRN